MTFIVNHQLEISVRSRIQFLLYFQYDILNDGNYDKSQCQTYSYIINQMSVTSCLCDSNAIINTLMTFNRLRNFWNHDQNL